MDLGLGLGLRLGLGSGLGLGFPHRSRVRVRVRVPHRSCNTAPATTATLSNSCTWLGLGARAGF